MVLGLEFLAYAVEDAPAKSGQGEAAARSPDAPVLASEPGALPVSAAAVERNVKATDAAGGKPREIATLRGHTSWVTAVAFLPDGHRLATGSVDNTAKVWDLSSGQELLTLHGYNDGVWSVAYSPDGRQLLTGAGNGVRLWDAETGCLVLTFPTREGEDWVEAAALRRPRDSHGDRVEMVAFSPNGKQVLSASNDGKVILWDAANGDLLLTFRPVGHSAIHAASFSPDGRTVAIGAYSGRVGFWDARCGHELLNFQGHTNAIEFLAYFPEGGRMVTASYDGTARIWDAVKGSEVSVFRGHHGPVTCVAVSPDGRRVVTGGSDGCAKVWDARTGEEQLLLQEDRQAIEAVAFSPDGTRVATTSLGQTVRIWDVTPTTQAPAPGELSDVLLESEYVPLAIRIHGDPLNREIRSFRLVGKVPPEGDGAGKVWIDTRQADLDSFGDVVRRLGPEPIPIEVELRYVAAGVGPSPNRPTFGGDSQASKGFRRYDLVFPGGVLGGRLQLVLGTATLGPHRLLVYGPTQGRRSLSSDPLTHILFLNGVPPVQSAVPDALLGQEIDLTGYYTAVDGRVRRLYARGRPGGVAKIDFDPNFITFDDFGEPTATTLIGYQSPEIALEAAADTDPQGWGRRLYWAVSNDSRNTNRVAVVLGRTEIGPHRILLYRGEQVAFVVPGYLAARRNRESQASEVAGLSPGEQRAIADLYAAVGYGFHLEIKNGQAVALHFTTNIGPVLPGGVLARLPYLHSIFLNGGRLHAVGLQDLEQLAHLRNLYLSGVECESGSLAALGNLRQLESLRFHDCRGIDNAAAAHLANLTSLQRLSFYSERLHRREPAPSPCITDAGLVHLKRLIHLQHLDLFGHDLSDASVAILSAMPDLEDLALSGRAFTDAGLGGLGNLSKLRRLRLFETAVTTKGVTALTNQLPQLEVEAWGLDGHD